MKNKNRFNNKLKSLLLFSIISFSSSPVLAASVGLGVSLNNSQGLYGYDLITPAILIPIEVNKHLLIEPFFSTLTYRSKSAGDNTKITNDTFGLGIFYTRSLNDNASQYYGAKLSKTMIGISSDFSNDADYWTLTPLAGFKYDATQSISAAFELGVNYTDGNENYSFDATYDIREYSVYAGLTMRYLFK